MRALVPACSRRRQKWVRRRLRTMLSDYGASADVIIGARCQACPLAFVRDDNAKWARLIKEKGIVVEGR